MMMRWGVSIVALGVMWAMLPPAWGRSRTLDRTVALVNSDVITLDQVKEAATAKWSSRSRREPTIAELKRALEQLIDFRLLVQAAQRARIPVDETDISAQVEELAAEDEAKWGGREAYRSYLKEVGIDLAAMKQITRRRAKELVQVHGLITSRVSVNREDVVAFEKELREKKLPVETCTLHKLLLLCPPDASAGRKNEVRERALAIHQQLLDGRSFMELVLEFSEDAATCDDDGWIGTLPPGDLDPALSAAVRELKGGQHSPPVWTSSGCHFLLLVRRHTARDMLLERRFGEQRAALVKQWRKEGVIEIIEERLRPAPPEKDEKSSER